MLPWAQVTTPMFQTRRDARRCLIGLVMFAAALPLAIIGFIQGFHHHTGRIRDWSWFWDGQIAIMLVFVGNVVASGPMRRARRGKKTNFGLLSPTNLREAIRVAISGPKGSAPLPPDFPQLFADRRSARIFLIGIVLIPTGFALPFVLSITFVGTSVKNTTPAWVELFGLLLVLGIVLVLLTISRFSTREESLPPAQRHRAGQWWGLFLSGDGLRQAFRVARG